MLNDCLYRNIAESTRFIISGDVDEIFFPGPELRSTAGESATLFDLAKHMLALHPTAAAFGFNIKDYPLEYPDGGSIVSTDQSDAGRRVGETVRLSMT
jgi:hypothetical protein